MTDDEKMDYAIKVFTTLLSDQQDRLERGAMLRQAMHDALARGEKPTGYRAKWLMQVSEGLVQYLIQAAEDFDASHPDDKVSVMDILDVLATVTAQFRARLED